MVTAHVNSNRPCVYCGDSTKKVRRGEHIVPEVIGGKLTISEASGRHGRQVCAKCNNGVLSVLDKELCNRSYLSVIASQEIDAHIWQAWDVDHESNNLLLEARPSWTDGRLSHLACYPQLTFERGGAELRGNVREMERFGREDFQKVLLRAAQSAYQRYMSGQKNALIFEPIQSVLTAHGYRFAPRIFTRHSISDIAKEIDKRSFIVRYLTTEDRRRALLGLSRLDTGERFNSWTQTRGSHVPSIALNFDSGTVIRALIKIGINLLAAYCERTPVTCDSFREAISIIRGEKRATIAALACNGFVQAADIQCMAHSGCHSFRLEHWKGVWKVFTSALSHF